MTYKEAMDYINSVSKKGSILGLDTTKELLNRLNNPQDKLKFIHIAGTNGKGSVLANISGILTAAGYKTGRYVSPIIYSYNEKIQINGENIPNEVITELVEKIKPVCEQMVSDGFEQPTVFEIETAMGFMYFEKEACDIVVLETGMGGRDDSTNVVKNTICSVIMSISLDHVGMIGNNLTEIAQCKAGIIKPDSNVVLYKQSDEVMDIIKEVAVKNNSKLVISEPSKLSLVENSLYGQVFNYKEYQNLTTHLLGDHQLLNAACALEVVDILKDNGYAISDEAVREGIGYVRWPGRFEIVNDRPLIIMDGAHNPDGAKIFANSVSEYLKGYTRIFVMGVLKDKDYKEIIKLTNDLASVIITINPDNARALSDTDLKDAIDEIKTRDIPVLSAGRIESGIELASQLAMQLDDDKIAIVVFGSLSFLGDLGRYLYR